ncbi:lipopolysaccharide biosynthesis protein [Duganella levis]|uniref:Oligosaccharide flippase family protein n=1 Tax=Duganella levis TaxID=2692169 RepID=A0ABW9W5R1_9BURK|nr:oligosaccharide flippase family protein [Duganella levis]
MSAVMRVVHQLEARFRVLTFARTMVPTMGALALQFVTFAITARGLGVEQFGRYTALLAIVGIGVELTGLGGADLLVRAVSRDRTAFPRYYGNMLLLGALTTPIVVALGVAVAVGAMQTTVGWLPLITALLAEIVIARMSASLELVMVAHGHTVRAGWVRMTTVVVRLLLAVAYFMLFGWHELDSWIAVVCAQSLVLTAVYVGIGARLYGRPVWQLLQHEMGGGLSFCITQTARSAQSNLDRMVLSRYADDATLGLYGAASRFMQLGMFPLQVVTRIIYPNYFVHGKEGIAASRRYAIRMTPLLFGVGVLSGGAVALAALLAPYALGKGYEGSTAVTLGLACALPFMALQYPAADALTGAGRQSLRALIYSLSAVGFGFVLLGGAYLGGIRGVVLAFLLGHLLLALIFWAVALLCRDSQPAQR